jgi:hypothetical protein
MRPPSKPDIERTAAMLIQALAAGGSQLDDTRRRIDALRKPLLQAEVDAADDKAKLEKVVEAVTKDGGPEWFPT